MKLLRFILILSGLGLIDIVSGTSRYSNIFTFCAGLCNYIETSNETDKLLVCQRRCHDGMIDGGFGGNMRRSRRRHRRHKKRGIIRRAGRFVTAPVRYAYRKIFPKNRREDDFQDDFN